MKKKIWVPAGILAAVLLLLLMLPRQDQNDRVTFYYVRKDYLYGQNQGCIGSEIREVGHRAGDFPYLLALYLEGPADPGLLVPFPGKNMNQVQTLAMKGKIVKIQLADLGVGMRDSEFSLSCAALARTCLEITGAERVIITSGERSVTMSMDKLLLYDESTSVRDTEERE